MIEFKRWLLLALAFTVLMVLLNLSSIEKRTPSPLLGKAVEEKFDYAMKGMSSFQFDEKGRLSSTLKADSLFHYPQQQLIRLENPVVDFAISDQLWSLHANSGTLSEANEELKLTQLVTISNHLTAETKPLKTPLKIVTIQINELIVKLKEKLAFSQNSVTFFSDNWQMQGDGLAIDIEKKTIKILRNIEAVHDIP